MIIFQYLLDLKEYYWKSRVTTLLIWIVFTRHFLLILFILLQLSSWSLSNILFKWILHLFCLWTRILQWILPSQTSLTIWLLCRRSSLLFLLFQLRSTHQYNQLHWFLLSPPSLLQFHRYLRPQFLLWVDHSQRTSQWLPTVKKILTRMVFTSLQTRFPFFHQWLLHWWCLHCSLWVLISPRYLPPCYRISNTLTLTSPPLLVSPVLWAEPVPACRCLRASCLVQVSKVRWLMKSLANDAKPTAKHLNICTYLYYNVLIY